MIFVWILIGLIVLLGIVVLIGYIVSHISFKKKPYVEVSNDELPDPTMRFLTEEKYLNPKLYKNLHITTSDDLVMIAHYLKAEKPTHKYVLLLHGYRGYAYEWSSMIKLLHDNGYNVITVDERAHGDSQGKYFTMGYLEAKDGLLWVDHIIELDPSAQIIVYGHSMGAHIAMLMASNNLPLNVRGFIEDCGYNNVHEELLHAAKNIYKYPLSNIFVPIGELFSKIFYKYRVTDCANVLNKCYVPMCFIHCCDDRFVPFKNLDIVYNAAKNCEKERHEFKGAGHCSGEFSETKRYHQIILNFIEKHTK